MNAYNIVFHLFLLFLTNIEAQELKSPATEFRRHRIVRPTLHHGRTKREITSTRHMDGLHHPEVTMTLNLDGVDHILDLILNEDLVAAGHTISYQKNGSMVTYKPSIEELDICQYSGKVRGKENSWVAVSTCHGVQGVIQDGQQMRYIEPAQAVEAGIGSKHFVYDHSDLTTKHLWGHDGGVTNNSKHHPEHKNYRDEKIKILSRFNRYKRDTSEDSEVRGPFNVNKQSRYVELVLVADNGEYRANGENIHTVYRQMKDVANIINSLYAPLNIFIALVGVEIWTEENQIAIVKDSHATLMNFLKYRKEILNDRIPNDNAHLLTLQAFDKGVIGRASLGKICTSEYSGGITFNFSQIIGLVAKTMAHELGHNFGLDHDGPDCKCPDKKCIMTSFSDMVAPTHWSDCSRKQLALSFEHGLDHCLRNKPKRLVFDWPTTTPCGNGFVEPGEQCDCGLRADPACAACCDPGTCLLRSNATCASGECCDPLTCRPKSAGTVCRSAERECDLPEFCTGHSEFCPRDVHKMDATPCSNDQAFCVRGSCRSHTDQCRLLWGSTGLNADAKCYDLNRNGKAWGNCGYNRSSAQYHSCEPEDTACGMLHCTHTNGRLEYGQSITIKILSINYPDGLIITRCITKMHLGAQDGDPGMVPDGAKCGEDKMCLKHKCVSASGVRERVAQREDSVCPSDCSGHGVCNSEGRIRLTRTNEIVQMASRIHLSRTKSCSGSGQ